MTIADDDLVIDVDIDGGIEADAPAAKPAPKFQGKPQSRISPDLRAEWDRERGELTRVVETERTRAADAEKRAQEASEKASTRERQAISAHLEKLKSEWQSRNADKGQIEAGINAEKARVQSAREKYRAAREAGDVAAETEAVTAISDSQSIIHQLETGKVGAENEITRLEKLYEEHAALARDVLEQEERKAKEAKQRAETEAAAKASQPKALTGDEWIESARSSVGDDGVAWLKEHKEFATDQKLNRKLFLFAEDYALDNGQESLKSKAFLDALNEKFFPNQESEGDDVAEEVDDEPAPAPPKKSAVASAPVSRSSPGRSTTQVQNGKVRLTSDEQSIALQMYPDMDRNSALKKYASNKALAIRDGHYNR